MMNDLIRVAATNGAKALSEYTAKQVLESYGISITREILVQTRAEALAAAQTIGYPVVAKACAAELMHKSEAGAVAIGIQDETALQKAYDRIVASVGAPLEGVLIQEMVSGPRELVVGLTRDPQFGPCVMLGLGGVLTEALKDVVFRVAPFDRIEALDMMAELRAQALLGCFRGQAAADRHALADTLVAIGRIGIDHAQVAEIDINPIIIAPDGRIKAVDALIVLT